MSERIRILFLSANPWTTSRILVDEEAREIFEKLQEGSCRDMFELIKHEAIRALDLQRPGRRFRDDTLLFEVAEEHLQGRDFAPDRRVAIRSRT